MNDVPRSTMLDRMDVKSIDLASIGADRIAWAEQAMPVVASIRRRFANEQPLAGKRIAACLHVTAETAVLVRALAAGGARVRLCASNPLSTQDEVAASLAVDDGIEVFAIAGEDRSTYFRHLRDALDTRPHLVMDDGADLTTLVHTDATELGAEVVGGTEETTTGVTRMRAMAADGVLRYPIIAVNDAKTKHLFDNRYGTGQSTIDGILRTTNRLLAGKCFVVCGYGHCGRGVAARAAGMGARVIVTEVDPVRALEAVMDGFEVQPIERAAAVGDVFCTVTGIRDVIGAAAFARMKDGAILANAGHFDCELDLLALRGAATAVRRIRPSLDEFTMDGGRRLYLVGEGRLANLAAAEGHPADVMDLSFANQALSAERLLLDGSRLPPGVHGVPDVVDTEVARLALAARGVSIDALTLAQQEYRAAWRAGT